MGRQGRDKTLPHFLDSDRGLGSCQRSTRYVILFYRHHGEVAEWSNAADC
jgi:hypothetical protein